MIQALKRLLCNHPVDKLRFVKYLHGDEINQHNGKRFEYECIKCGASIYKLKPVFCDGCKHIYYMSDGSAHCDLDYKGKACIAQYYKYFKPKYESEEEQCPTGKKTNENR